MPEPHASAEAVCDEPRKLSKRFSSVAQRENSKLGSLRYAVAGLSSGFVSSLLLHPLDVVNTRVQVHDGKMTSLPKYRGTGHALVTIVRDDGLLALYSGLAPNLIGQTLSWGCFFWTHAFLKDVLRATKDEEFEQDTDGVYRPQLTFGERFGCSAGAGMVTATVTQPIWVIKTRMQLQTSQARVYSGVLDVIRHVREEEGWRGLWRGLGPSLALVSNIAIQMFLYEELHGRLHHQGWQSFVCGAAAKVCASCATYPLMLVRTRLQQRDPALAEARPRAAEARYYSGALDVVRKTLAGEGVGGLYKGLSTNLLRVVPAAAVNFYVYEAVKRRL